MYTQQVHQLHMCQKRKLDACFFTVCLNSVPDPCSCSYSHSFIHLPIKQQRSSSYYCQGVTIMFGVLMRGRCCSPGPLPSIFCVSLSTSERMGSRNDHWELCKLVVFLLLISLLWYRVALLLPRHKPVLTFEIYTTPPLFLSRLTLLF